MKVFLCLVVVFVAAAQAAPFDEENEFINPMQLLDAEVADEVVAPQVRVARAAFQQGGGFPGNPGGQRDSSRGSWGVSVNKDKGRGPQVRVEGQGNIYRSPKGNVNVDAYGRSEFGKGRKPDHNVGISVKGRF